MAFLQYVVNRIVSFIFNIFSPKIKYTKKFPEAIDPAHFTDGSLGFDLFTPKDVMLEPGERTVIDTGIVFECPIYLGMYVWDKSSVALGKKLSVCGGVIDPDYRGSVGVVLHNLNSENVFFHKGSAIAQCLFHLRVIPALVKVETEEELSETERGKRGFGGSEWMEK